MSSSGVWTLILSTGPWALLLVGPPTLAGEPVHIVWDESWRFERSVRVAPAEMARLCGDMFKGQAIGWDVDADRPVNIVLQARTDDGIAVAIPPDVETSSTGRLNIKVNAEYCWVLRNSGTAHVHADVRLRKGL